MNRLFSFASRHSLGMRTPLFHFTPAPTVFYPLKRLSSGDQRIVVMCVFVICGDNIVYPTDGANSMRHINGEDFDIWSERECSYVRLPLALDLPQAKFPELLQLLPHRSAVIFHSARLRLALSARDCVVGAFPTWLVWSSSISVRLEKAFASPWPRVNIEFIRLIDDFMYLTIGFPPAFDTTLSFRKVIKSTARGSSSSYYERSIK